MASEVATQEREPWAFVAFKGSRFGGVISPEMGKSKVRTFCGKFAAEGYSIKPVYDRSEYLALLESLPQ